MINFTASYPESMGKVRERYFNSDRNLYRKSMIILDDQMNVFKVRHNLTSELHKFERDSHFNLLCTDRSILSVLIHDIRKHKNAHEYCSCGFYSYFDYKRALESESTVYPLYSADADKFYNLGYVMNVSSWNTYDHFEHGVRSAGHKIKNIIVDKCFDEECQNYALGFIVDSESVLIASCLDHIKLRKDCRNMTFFQFDEISRNSTDYECVTVKSIDPLTHEWASLFENNFPNSRAIATISRIATKENESKVGSSFKFQTSAGIITSIIRDRLNKSRETISRV